MELKAMIDLIADSANTVPKSRLEIAVSPDTVTLRLTDPERSIAVNRTEFAKIAKFIAEA